MKHEKISTHKYVNEKIEKKKKSNVKKHVCSYLR